MALFFKDSETGAARGTPRKLPPHGGRILFAVLLTGGLFALAAKSAAWLPAASDSLWTCFELSFAALLGLFGFEATKYA
jgi:hypothetical protein